MLTIIINGRQAVIRQNTSFEFVSENLLFSDADEYTLNISFPLRECPVNLGIFGFINRPGASIETEILDMQIISGRFHARGAGIVTGFSDIEVKVQFLGNRARENYYSDLDDVFINCLDLGEVPMGLRDASDVPVTTAWAGHAGNMDYVALPFVNEGTGHIINNTKRGVSVVPPADAKPGWNQVWETPEEAEMVQGYTMQLSWMPYLIDIARKIGEACGFRCNFFAWEHSKWYHLLLCHAVPASWNFYLATLLPHWSVLDFFRNLEPILEGYFDFDYRSMFLTFVPYADLATRDKVVTIDNVLDEFSSDTYDKENECNLISARYMGYETNDSKTGRLMSCEWFVHDYCTPEHVVDYATPEALTLAATTNNWRRYQGWDGYPGRGIYYARYIESHDRYVTQRIVSGYYNIGWDSFIIQKPTVFRVPAMLNNFGPRCVPLNRKDAESPDVTLNVVPALVDFADDRRMLFISLGDYEEKYKEPLVDEDESPIGQAVYDSLTMRILDEGKEDGSNAYFNNLAVGFYPGAEDCQRSDEREILPIFDILEFDSYWHCWEPKDPNYSLSLQDGAGKFAGIPKVNTNVKFEFSFIADTMPDIASIFVIRGHSYLCEKLTANFSGEGLSQKIRGTFWRII